jgi:hypothetical protein
VTESLGPTNTREYVVAVKFRSKRLATGRGHSIQEAEMNAAANALEASEGNSFAMQLPEITICPVFVYSGQQLFYPCDCFERHLIPCISVSFTLISPQSCFHS